MPPTHSAAGWRRSVSMSERVASAGAAARGADIVVTVTTSTHPVLALADVDPGTFVAGVGADSPTKHELAPDLLRESRVVVDVRAQSAAGGDLGHAVRLGVMTEADVYAELADIVTGRVAGRSRDDERWVFDSVGLAVQDHAAARMILDRAGARDDLPSIRLDDSIGPACKEKGRPKAPLCPLTFLSEAVGGLAVGEAAARAVHVLHVAVDVHVLSPIANGTSSSSAFSTPSDRVRPSIPM